ncbi:MAG: Hsp70 family protein [Lentisphaeria bacterium]|nr:Hsp70 family protein [Lentisphaeria bacterium]
MTNRSESIGRFWVGIDLGTTNCSVCYADLTEETPVLRQLLIPQLIAPGEVAAEPLLPSFCYLAGEHDLPEHALDLPWTKANRHAVGRLAREQGSAVPERLVASAKSWLAHAGVDRQKPILPWGSDLARQNLSPVRAAFLYLDHIRAAWDRQFSRLKDEDGTPCKLSEQPVVVTVPASFDEAARNLTVTAARQAGFKHLTLLEEPLAAFYAWIAHHDEAWKDLLPAGAQVLVIDVGGGTTDFSIIQVEDNAVLRRTAVGDHLLLGGDNMDMTLARLAEKAWNTKLPQRQWSQLCQECRRAKEALLGPQPVESCTVQVTGTGSSLLAGLRTHAFTRQEVLDTIISGFFPNLPPDAPAPDRRRGIQEMGLPYAADPAITKHLLDFLRHAGPTPRQAAAPTHVLFNGGAMLPETFRQKLRTQLGAWQQRDALPELHAADLSLAVSVGAAYYGLARTGRGVRVKGGIARAFFLKVEQNDQQSLVCVMPRDTDEGMVQRLADKSFLLRANQPVAFPLSASATRLGDRLGDVIPTQTDGITALPPLHTVLKYGRKTDQAALQAVVSSQLNETGTLEIWCEVPATGHRFPLTFDLRQHQPDSPEAAPGAAARQDSITLAEDRIRDALHVLTTALAAPDQAALPGLNKVLEDALDLPRTSWNAALLRRFADHLLRNHGWRSLSPAHEARWLNLTGFCLRPGCGSPGDELRVREAWKLWHAGPLAGKNSQVQAEWWTFWRRLAAGLRPGQQDQAAATVVRAVLTASGANAVRSGHHPGLEQWRLAAALEKIPHTLKLRLLTGLLRQSGKLEEAYFWVIARLAARRLFLGPLDAVLPAAQWAPLFTDLLRKATQAKTPRLALFAVANTARLTGIRTIDLPEENRGAARDFLQEHQAPVEWLDMVTAVQHASEDFQDQVAGDALPLGLVLQPE